MKRNLGNLDRIIRLLVGGGLVPVLTAVVGFCPAYCPIGLSTCRKDTSARS